MGRAISRTTTPNTNCPTASETIADPHNFLVEVAATAGLPAAGLFVLVGAALLWRLRHHRVRTG